MPNFDSGKYFLTALVPLRETPVPPRDGELHGRSRADAVREALSLLPTARQSPYTNNPTAPRPPFAISAHTHFARLFVIDDLPNNGRVPANVFAAFIRGDDPTVPRKVDCLRFPYLAVVVEFDAEEDSDDELKRHLSVLWNDDDTIKQLKTVFEHCHDFDVTGELNPEAFFVYIKRHQVETTMPFSDYRLTYDNLNSSLKFAVFAWLAATTAITSLIALGAPLWDTTILDPNSRGAAAVFGLFLVSILWWKNLMPQSWKLKGLLVLTYLLAEGFWFLSASLWENYFGPLLSSSPERVPLSKTGCLAIFIITVLATALLARFSWSSLNAHAQRPFPSPPRSNLSDLLKALYVQQAFTEFVIRNQGTPASTLHSEFGKFLSAHKINNEYPRQARAVLSTQGQSTIAINAGSKL